MMATLLPAICLAAYSPSTLPCWTSLAITRNAVAKPCCVYFGLVAEPEICGMPASKYSFEAGIVVPEFRWPTTPLTLASTSFWATIVPCFGSA